MKQTNQKRVWLIIGAILLVGVCCLTLTMGGGMGASRSDSPQTETAPTEGAQVAGPAVSGEPTNLPVIEPTEGVAPTAVEQSDDRDTRTSRSLGPDDFPNYEMWSASSQVRFDRNEFSALFGSIDLTVTEVPRSGNVLQLQPFWGEELPFMLVGQQFPAHTDQDTYRYISWGLSPELGRYPVRACALIRQLYLGDADTEIPWMLATEYTGEQIVLFPGESDALWQQQKFGVYEFAGNTYRVAVLCYGLPEDVEPIRELIVGLHRTPNNAEVQYEPLLLGWFIEFENR